MNIQPITLNNILPPLRKPNVVSGSIDWIVTPNTGSAILNTLSDTHFTIDDPFNKRLAIQLREARPAFTLVVTGSNYDALGEWTDASLNQYIINTLGLVTGSAS